MVVLSENIGVVQKVSVSLLVNHVQSHVTTTMCVMPMNRVTVLTVPMEMQTIRIDVVSRMEHRWCVQ